MCVNDGYLLAVLTGAQNAPARCTFINSPRGRNRATRAKAPNFIAQCLSGFENPLPRTEVRGYTWSQFYTIKKSCRRRSLLFALP